MGLFQTTSVTTVDEQLRESACIVHVIADNLKCAAAQPKKCLFVAGSAVPTSNPVPVAPECSVTSYSFESKWYVVHGLMCV